MAGREKSPPSPSICRRPLVANITNATSVTYSLLLALQLCTPLGLAYGWIGGASEDRQRDYARKSTKPKAH
jgi:hypothetical protein